MKHFKESFLLIMKQSFAYHEPVGHQANRDSAFAEDYKVQVMTWKPILMLV